MTEAVFGYLLQEASLADRVRAWLGHEPSRLAFQTALAQSLLSITMIPCLQPGGTPPETPTSLTEILRSYLTALDPRSSDFSRFS